ncbi:uncharacterized protein KY384_006830 [Bacidia gigantensis]|uniref:uncharacterized protein n=1 Tax=Bacidia gigantensis TaxID=2732470 RepID=UPI001D0454DD|nr:uncharacterized protein KY384_006830 [Bacidia gigantensis]KAG8527914.1 hypothetical protein KY384_006830 [Bacidia gigantensis]
MERRDESLSPPPFKKRKQESTTTNHAVNKFFTPTSKKAPESLTWRTVHESLLLGRYAPPQNENEPPKQPEKRRKIALFDLDSTLVLTSSGNIYSKDASDWKWWHISVPSSIKRLYEDGYQVVIISNQGRLSLKSDLKTAKADQRTLSTFKAKISAILGHFDFPITFFAATSRDVYRKPRVGMWNEVLEELDLDERNDGVIVDECFFVGDAGGRAATVSQKADHASSDRDFATNLGVKFSTPEEYFLNEEPRPYVRHFEPSDYLTEASTSTDSTPIAFEKKNPLDIVILCGSPGGGKSTFYFTKLRPLGYERANQDTLKTREKCVVAARKMLDERLSVAVDNTNADTEVRAVWVKLAREYGVPVRCVYFTAPVRLCEHNDTVRALAGEHFNPEKRVILPHSAFAGFRARFKPPNVKEGFEDIVRADFQFKGDEEARKVWCRYWI